MDAAQHPVEPAGPDWREREVTATEQPPTPATPRRLPLEAIRTADGDGWLIRLPVRAEQVTVTKEVVVRERVAVRRQMMSETARIETEIRRERLRVDTDGDVPIASSREERS